MAKTIRELLVKVGIDADTRMVATFDRSVKSLKRQLLGLGIVAIAGGAALAKMTLDTARQGDEAAKTAKRIRITAEEYQELTFAMERAGGTGADIEKAMRRMAKLTLDLDRGLSTATDAFDDLGLKKKDIEGLGQADLFTTLVGALREVEDGTKQVALAQELFGRGGGALLPLINDQTSSLADLRQEARALGYVLDEEAARRSEEFADRLLDAKTVLVGLRNTIGLELMPVITDMLDGFKQWFLLNREIIRQRIGEMAEKAAKGLEGIAKFAGDMDDLVQRMGGWERVLRGLALVVGTIVALKMAFAMISAGGAVVSFITSAAGSGGLIGVLGGLGTAVGTTGVAFSGYLGIMLAVLVAAGLVGLAIEDLVGYLRGSDSAIGAFIESWRDVEGVLGSVARTVESLINLIDTFNLLRTGALSRFKDPEKQRAKRMEENIAEGAEAAGLSVLAAETVGRGSGSFGVSPEEIARVQGLAAAGEGRGATTINAPVEVTVTGAEDAEKTADAVEGAIKRQAVFLQDTLARERER